MGSLQARGSGNVFTDLGFASDEVSDLVRGRVELFSIDTLVEMLTRLEILVTVRTKPVPKVA